MNILYDGRIFQLQKAGGINRYFCEIISGLPQDCHPSVTGVDNFGVNAPSHPNLKKHHCSRYLPGRVSVQLNRLWAKPRLLGNADLVHPTYYELTAGYSLSDFKCPMVLTAYDFIYAIYPKLFRDSEPVIRDQRNAILKASHVICISKATENDLLERFPEKAGSTSVIYLGSSFEIQKPLDAQAVFENPFFLYVGGRAGYKNFSFLLSAFTKACESNQFIRLKVAGAPLTTDERWRIHLLGIDNRVEVVVYPDEQNLIDLYRSSLALLYPSLHEGFGIPPLEAMACRTLAITSNTASLPEVMGDAGIMLDPKKEADWVECILKSATPSAHRDLMIERGLERVRQFSWRRAVDQHLDVYRSLTY